MPNQAKDDVYKPAVKTNQPQPAVVKYKVQKDDTYVSLGGQSVIAANPGVPQLSTGQVINLPNPNAAFPVTNNPYLNRPAVSYGGSFYSGSGAVNYQPTTTGGMLSPEKNIVQAPQKLLSGSFYSGAGQVNLTGVSAGNGASGAGGTNSNGGVVPRPTGVYTGGNDPESIAWRRYWNQQAGGTGNEVSYLPSAKSIWEKNAAQRRRENGRGGGSDTVVQPQDFTPYGNNVVVASWRVG